MQIILIFSQAKLLEQHIASLFGTASEDGMPSADQFNIGLQKIAGKFYYVN